METPREGQKGLGVCFEAKSICQFILPSADWLLVPKVSAFFCSLNNRGEFSLRKMTGLEADKAEGVDLSYSFQIFQMY